MKKFLLPYALVLMVACSKGNGKDTDPPVIVITAPANNQAFTSGQSIMVSGNASDNKFTNQIHIVISNLATGVEYLHVHIHPNTSVFTFNQSYTPQAGITYKIDVIVDDASAKSSAKSIQISCN